MQAPDSSSTKHSLTMIQRQYIDSRFSESVSDYMKSILEALDDLKVELMNVRSKVAMVNHRIAKIEESLHRDDKPSEPALNSSEYLPSQEK